ncbi:MAG: glycoside hydrolase family 25 protein [Eubacterium sp.]|nr:glycoside hydrolase family 25 protein [Eubacterium sp.]
MSYFGVDLSEFNGSIDWDRLAKHVDFAILRIGWVGNRDNSTLDEKFEEYYRNARRAGIKIGAYVYIYSNSEKTAREGAEWAVERLKGKTLNLPVYCDMEDKSIANLGRAKLTAIAKAFNSVIEKHGYWAGIYANRNWYDNFLDKDLKKRYTSWIADYSSGKDKYKGEYDMWQNSSVGRVEGISGNVDTDYLYRNLFKEIKSNDKEPEKPIDDRYPKPVKWKNGSTKETVYKRSDLKEKIGTIFAYSDALCYGKSGDALIVVYDIAGTNLHKAGFVAYKDGVKKAPSDKRLWKNGYTPEVVYADTGKRLSVGSIFPYSTADCLGKIDDMYLVRYSVDGTKAQKCGFVEYHGGIR